MEWMRDPSSSRWLWMLSAVVPILVAVSYPAVFVAGGISLALAPSVLRSGGARSAWAGWSTTCCWSPRSSRFTSRRRSFRRRRFCENYRNGCWAEAFPPLDRPWMLPVWLLDVHTGTMMAYPAGDQHGASAVTLLCVLAGCMALYRQGRKTSLAILLAPFALGLLAAFLGRYPYGGAPGSCSISSRQSACSPGWDWLTCFPEFVYLGCVGWLPGGPGRSGDAGRGADRP